jgi:moderate conductance mechanosensitive channel
LHYFLSHIDVVDLPLLSLIEPVLTSLSFKIAHEMLSKNRVFTIIKNSQLSKESSVIMSAEDLFQHYILPIGGAFLLAWIVHRLSGRIVERFVLLNTYVPEGFRIREERRRTLHNLLSSLVSFIAFLIAILFTMARFVDANTLVWVVGLFSAAFGLGAQPLMSDFFTGIGFFFENSFDVGEKVEILGYEGTIEKINLRTVTLRAPTGELFVIPNGQVRTIRNFSRGLFSTANITLTIETADLNRALPLLNELGKEALILLPDMLENWQIISTSGVMGQEAELTLLVKTRFGAAAEMRPRLLALLQERFAQADITLM